MENLEDDSEPHNLPRTTRDRQSRNSVTWLLPFLLLTLLIVGVVVVAKVLWPTLSIFVGPEWSTNIESVSQPFCGEWDTIVGPRLFTGDIEAVAASSPTDVWAAGSRYRLLGGAGPLLMHWDGNTWVEHTVEQSSSNHSNGALTLVGLSVLDANNAWSVGWSGISANPSAEPLIVHWDGNNWNPVDLPTVSFSSAHLEGVYALSADNVWAVGWYKGPGLFHRTLVLHWDGNQVTIVPSPNPSEQMNASLWSVSAVSASDIWAVGTQGADSKSGQTLIMHWNGKVWSIVPSPNDGAHDTLLSVSSITQNEVWAVGTAVKPLTQTVYTVDVPLIMRWDGKNWALSHVSGLGPRTLYRLNGISARSPSDIWAVGSQTTRGLATQFIVHWDGTQWSIVDGPARIDDQSFRSITTLADGSLWTVGDIHPDEKPALGLTSRFHTSPCSSPTGSVRN